MRFGKLFELVRGVKSVQEAIEDVAEHNSANVEDGEVEHRCSIELSV